MTPSVRTVLIVLAMTGLALSVAGCSGESRKETGDKAAEAITDRIDRETTETYRVTYEVTGEGVAAVEFNGGKGTATDPRLESVETPGTPWSTTVTLKGIAAPTVLALAGPEGSEVTCRIIHKGELLVEKSVAKPLAPASCVALSPIAE
ncbi:MAG TPA: hypothetical protein DEQ61_17230 [Streptomyces sp.]|nr:hypothetical protein [Streptomyces sp.]